jgi:hypothetical protein
MTRQFLLMFLLLAPPAPQTQRGSSKEPSFAREATSR